MTNLRFRQDPGDSEYDPDDTPSAPSEPGDISGGDTSDLGEDWSDNAPDADD